MIQNYMLLEVVDFNKSLFQNFKKIYKKLYLKELKREVPNAFFYPHRDKRSVFVVKKSEIERILRYYEIELKEALNNDLVGIHSINALKKYAKILNSALAMIECLEKKNGNRI